VIINLEDVIRVVEGVPSPGNLNQEISTIIIDSRDACPGSLFVAFPGEHVDGHDFVADSARGGAVAALVDRDVEPNEGLIAIRVANTQTALQKLAIWQRSKFVNLQVIGITGSSGKTTTKELVASVVSQKFAVLKTQGNKNNEIGLPLTMFQIEAKHEWAVLEMGMSAAGEIKQLCNISKPGIGIITNIGEAHILHLGSKEAIMHAKFELAENLTPPAVLILNGDDPWQRRRAEAGLPVDKIVFYGLGGGDVRAENVQSDIYGNTFDVCWEDQRLRVNVALPGGHNVSNALAAFAAGLELGIAPDIIARGLSMVRGEKRRLQAFDINGYTVIDDSYNANPDSTSRALQLLGSYPPKRRKVAFLGSMLELGNIAAEKHRLIGAVAVENDVQLLVAVGENAGDIRQGALEAGMDAKSIVVWPDSTAAIDSIGLLKPDDVVLIKGSLGVKMDKIVQYLRDGGH